MSGSRKYRPRFGYDIRIRPDAEQPRVKPATRACSIPGCGGPAEHKVPKNRLNLEDRHWLCREHVREHNARWNFFAGMSESDIENYRIEAITGHRPTWPLGKRAAMKNPQGATSPYRFEDGFAIFEEAAEPARPARVTRLTKGQADALAILQLEEGATLHEIKARYKELVKKFHPDANGGDRGTEERLKQVIKAYGHLRATGLV